MHCEDMGKRNLRVLRIVRNMISCLAGLGYYSGKRLLKCLTLRRYGAKIFIQI